MRSNIGDVERLKHILDAIAFIEKAINQISEQQFQDEFVLHTAVVKWLENIGEACYKINKDLKNTYANIEWRKIEGLRHVLVHEYFGIDLLRIWIVLQDYLPNLKTEINIILKNF